MQKQKQIITKASYAVIAVLLATYLLFPEWYRHVSQVLFKAIYTQHAQLPQSDTATTSDTPAFEKDRMLPLFVIARPPQTPYDYVITTVPEQYQPAKYEKGVWYVHDTTGRPVGYVEKTYPSLLIITLFSASGSSEIFSVGGYSARGIGEGGGSFSLQVPIGMAIPIGAPIIHQATGEIVSAVVAIERVPEKNVQKVIGVLGSSPLEMAVVYIARKASTAPSPKSIESAIETAKTIAEDAQDAREKQEESETAEQSEETKEQVPEKQTAE